MNENNEITSTEKAINFHPRAWKLMQEGKPFLVVASDEPYYKEVYDMIRAHEIATSRWSAEDEIIYLESIRAFLFRGTSK